MPRRSNPFQKLIRQLEQALNGDEFEVTESLELPDKITGQTREIDIAIQSKLGIHPVLISVECRDSSRPVSVEWLEQMWGKHRSLPTNKLILVAGAGFTAAARKKAAWLGVECYALTAAQSLDWMPKVRGLAFIKLLHFQMPVVTSATLLFSPDVAGELNFADLDLSTARLIDASGTESLAADVVQGWIRDPGFLAALEKNSLVDGSGTEFAFTRPLRVGTMVLSKSGGQYPIAAIEVKGTCRKAEELVTLLHETYGGNAVARASTKHGGTDLSVVLVERRGEDPILSLVARKQQPN